MTRYLLALLACLALAIPASAQTGTVKVETPFPKWGGELVVSGTFNGRLNDHTRAFVRVIAKQNGLGVYQYDMFVPNGQFRVSFPLTQQATYSAAGIFINTANPAAATVELDYCTLNGRNLTRSVIAGPVFITIGAK